MNQSDNLVERTFLEKPFKLESALGIGTQPSPGLAGSHGVADLRPATRDPGQNLRPATRDPVRPGPCPCHSPGCDTALSHCTFSSNKHKICYRSSVNITPPI